MKILYATLVSLFFSMTVSAQVASTLNAQPDPSKKLYVVEATCGECNYGMEGNDCDLAITFNGNHYYVDGVGIYEYGHPHKEGGFCVATRKAEVQGEVVNGRFKASYFKLLPNKKKGKKN
jgi:hypothetical protein